MSQFELVRTDAAEMDFGIAARKAES